MLWAYAKLRAGGAFGLFATGFYDGFICMVDYFEGGVREVVLFSMCHIIFKF